MTSNAVSTANRTTAGFHSRVLRWSTLGLVGSSWISAAMFGMYILAFYLVSIPSHLNSWNDNLPGLYEKGNAPALGAMSAHLLTGAIILLLGPIQLIGSLRERWPFLHRWLGRIYVFSGGIAGLGGLCFILAKGTIGGEVMNVGFGLYGLLMTVAAFETFRHARARRFNVHRAWAIRLFALAIGSWLYRMDYGFWLIAAHGLGHTHSFRGRFDVLMSFFFYLPNLLVAELFIRTERMPYNFGLRSFANIVLNAASLLIVVGTYYFARYYWGPAILKAVGVTL